jgi:thiol peroxidase
MISHANKEAGKMNSITFKGSMVKLIGELPAIGSCARDFILTKTDLSDVTLEDFAGRPLVLNIFPSLAVCAASVRRFNLEASNLDKVEILCVSLDLPFTHMSFCKAEDIKNVLTVSELRNRDFGDSYGIRMISGALAGLLARSIVIIDAEGKITYTQLVPEITQEPDYEEVLDFIKAMK